MNSPFEPILALETSGASLGVALISDDTILYEKNVTEGMIHGRALAPLIDEALKSANLKPAELAAVAVSIGPGSWTGLRIGISAAKTLAWAAKIPLIAVPSFEALALGAPGGLVLTLRDARSEGFFAALFDVTAPNPARLMDESVLKPAELIRAVKQLLSGHTASPLSVCGDEKCLAAIAAECSSNGWSLRTDLQHIPARALAQRAWARWQNGEGVVKSPDEIHKLGPLYLRASDPELKLKLRAC